MRKLNQIGRAIICACFGLMLVFAAGGLGTLTKVAAPEAGVKLPPELTRIGAAHGFSLQQRESRPRKIEGDWEGTLDAGAAKLKLILHVVRKDAILSATLDSPDQGATGLPIDAITLSSNSVHFEMNSLGGLYEGQLAKDDSQIEGKWIQGGADIPAGLQTCRCNCRRKRRG